MNITKGVVAKAQKVVLYGPEGIGKSSFAAQFPNPLFIDTEGSTNNMDVARMDKPSSWEFLNQQIHFVVQQHPCKTLVIDTIDWAEKLTINHVCARGKKESITSFGYGEGFIQLEEEFGKLLNKLSDVVDAGINVVLTAHSTITKFEQPDEMGAYDRYQLKLGNKTTAKTSHLVKEWADMVLFMNYKTFSVAADEKGKRHKGQGGERTIYATHHPAWDAKNRHDLPDKFPMDYGQIAHVFDKQPVSQKPSQQEPPTQPEPHPENVDAEPNPEPVQQPEPPALEPQQTAQEPNIDSSLPQALQDLMKANNVSNQEIEIVVSNKGYFPEGTPVSNYPKDFIEGVLVGAWDQVFQMIKDFRDSIPFN